VRRPSLRLTKSWYPPFLDSDQFWTAAFHSQGYADNAVIQRS
jgi:hypothetical protein